jgi:DNA-binding IclR family transcriptional regulator
MAGRRIQRAVKSEAAGDYLESAQRTLAALELLAGRPRGVTPKELSKALGLHLSTAYRLLNTLVAAGYSVRHPESGLFRLAQRVAYLHHGYLEGLQSPGDVPFVHGLQMATGATALLSRLEGENVVCTAVVAASNPESNFPVYAGMAAPAHAIATGRVILAGLDAAHLEAYFARCAATTDSPFPLTRPSELREALARIRHDGYAVDRGEGHPDICCVAAPIGIEPGGVDTAINVMVTSAKLQQEEPALIAAVLAAARAIDSMRVVLAARGESRDKPGSGPQAIAEIRTSLESVAEVMSRVS